ncbi:MAG: Na+/H+ antiporter subunit E [Actinomycetota bacterium]
MPLAGASAQASAPVNRRGWWSAAFVGLLLTWVLLNGLDFLVVGVLTAAVAALVPARLAQSHLPRVRPVQVALFLGYFVAESLRGAVDVAGRALRPAMPIDPGFFRYPTNLPPGLPLGLLMGTLSLLPGTLSVDLEGDGHTLVFHSLVGDTTDEARALEARISRLFHVTAP